MKQITRDRIVNAAIALMYVYAAGMIYLAWLIHRELYRIGGH